MFPMRNALKSANNLKKEGNHDTIQKLHQTVL